MYLLTQSPEEAPDIAVSVEIEFEQGNPVAVDGRRLEPVALLERVNRLGAEHGIGRVDLVENRFVGMKSRGCYETPGGTILVAARRALESITLDREVLHLRDSLVPRYAEMIYYGFWFSPERQALQRFLDECVQDVTGTVRLKLYKGNVTVSGPALAALAVPYRLRHVRGGHRLPAAGRRGVHQPQRPPPEDPLAARPPVLTGAGGRRAAAGGARARNAGRRHRAGDRRPARLHHDRHRAQQRLPGHRAAGRS